MNAYFFKMTKEERNNILDKHKSVYDGFVTQYVKPNQDPLYVQDYANDKGGLTVNNKGNITQYKNMNINEDIMGGSKFEPELSFESEMYEQKDMIGDGPLDLNHGTFDNDDFDGKEICNHCNGLGYDEETGEDCEWCDGSGEHNDLYIGKNDVFPKTKWSYPKDIELELDEEEIEPLIEQVEKNLDMFKRFKKYN